MDITVLSRARVYGRNEIGVDPLFFMLFSVLTTASGIMVSVASSVWWTSVLAVLFAAGICAFCLSLLKFAAANRKIGPKEYFILKKSVNYFAFLQFCFHSIALVVGWSSGNFGDIAYYSMYVGVVFSSLAYIPVYVALEDKKNQVRHGILEAVEKNGKTRYRSIRLYPGIFSQALSWVDAFVWAATLVIFINSLVFQLYQIPSESMVPEMYVGTRVFTMKTLTNPEIPLSLVKFPWVIGVKRFDRLVLNNPRYEMKKERAVADFFSNFLYMMTFTLSKNERYDEAGNIIADPLIKRLIGLPGEKLLMVDDVVYVKTPAETDFKPLSGDADYAYTLRSNRLIDMKRVQTKVFESDTKAKMERWDEEKKSLGIAGSGERLAALLGFFRSFKGKPVAAPGVKVGFRFTAEQSIGEAELSVFYSWFANNRESFLSELSGFLGAWKSAVPPKNEYERNALAVNLMFKIKFADAMKRYFEAFNSAEGQFSAADSLELNDFSYWYITRFFDSRNMNQFPSGDAYLAANEYFLMGDNRYNSLDCRHWKPMAERKLLCPPDPYSVYYLSLNAPFAVKAEKIRGVALFSVF